MVEVSKLEVSVVPQVEVDHTVLLVVEGKRSHSSEVETSHTVGEKEMVCGYLVGRGRDVGHEVVGVQVCYYIEIGAGDYRRMVCSSHADRRVS